ncbi:hypothetical protein Taro_005265 [Colocasia esculenta]|uniref:Small ribosomal subunit protein eS31 domain-containing protein n=1 Tax=Colocasia esculenta TaxID=4460 RepID=A0A843TTY9_COLES|nr:hypothetical protein [Colocasia esculenta]
MKLRKECPNAECGAGTFMANHHDRHYCGKCGLTYVYGGKKQQADGGCSALTWWLGPFANPVIPLMGVVFCALERSQRSLCNALEAAYGHASYRFEAFPCSLIQAVKLSTLDLQWVFLTKLPKQVLAYLSE